MTLYYSNVKTPSLDIDSGSTYSSPSLPLCPTFLRCIWPLSYLPLVLKQALYCVCSAERPAHPAWRSELIPAEVPFTGLHWLVLTFPSSDWLPYLSITPHLTPRGPITRSVAPLVTWKDQICQRLGLPVQLPWSIAADDCLSYRRRKLLCNYRE